MKQNMYADQRDQRSCLRGVAHAAVSGDDGKTVIYDVKEDIQSLPGYKRLQTEQGLFKMVKLDESRTCIYWSPEIDLPSDTIYEYGKVKRRKGENGLQ